MQPKKIAILGLALESNRYSSVVTRKNFEARMHMEGEAITLDARSNSPKQMKEVIGFYQDMDSAGSWEPIPLLIYGAGAGGPADATFIRETLELIRQKLAAVLAVDGVYILNHGGMISTEDDDPDGALYETVRQVVGPDVPVVTTIDLHANISQRMVDSASVIVSYRTDPHADQLDRGKEAAAILREIIDGIQPVVSNIRVPIVAPNVSLLTAAGPYADLINYGQSQIGPEILNVSVVAGFAFSDSNKNGLHIIVTARGNTVAAESLCTDLAQMAWDNRERFMWNLTPINEAVEMAVNTGENPSRRPLLLADLGDNVGAGGPANTLWMLEALYQAGAKGALIGSFCDPKLASKAHEAGVGSTFQANFQGDDWDRTDNQFTVTEVRVRNLHSGQFTKSRGPLAGMRVNVGPTCLLEMGSKWWWLPVVDWIGPTPSC